MASIIFKHLPLTFSRLSIGSDVSFTRDPDKDKYFLGQTSHFSENQFLPAATGGVQIPMNHPASAYPQKPEPKSKSAVKEQKTPRPANAFILYRKHWHAIVKAQNPSGTHNNVLSKIIGQQWQSESSTVRDEWKGIADQKAREHALLHPGYKYQPRKPSEKKRRTTGAKKAALAANFQIQTSAQPSPPSAPVIRGLGASQRPPLQIASRLEVAASEDYANLQIAELNDLPWGLFSADHRNATMFDYSEPRGQIFDEPLQTTDFYSIGRETVSPGAYLLN